MTSHIVYLTRTNWRHL